MISDLQSTYARLASILEADAEPIEVVERAEAHRAFWRPGRARVVLVAESHVYTTTLEMSRSLQAFPGLPSELPGGFVRLVYSLGYGENNLLDQPVTSPRNLGTPQFWKIFQSCIAKPETPVKYETVQKRTRDSVVRLHNKLSVLERLRDGGIWLVDASIAALCRPGAKKPSLQLREKVLQESWDGYVGRVVETSAPAAILCIGVGVAHALRTRLDKLGVPWGRVHQPQARLSRQKHEHIHALYSAVCDDPRKISSVPSDC